MSTRTVLLCCERENYQHMLLFTPVETIMQKKIPKVFLSFVKELEKIPDMGAELLFK